jgi:hypothetical protein
MTIKCKPYWKWSAYIVLLLFLCGIGVVAHTHFWVYQRIKNSPSGSQKYLRAVLLAYKWSNITGVSWELEIEKQNDAIQTETLENRLPYYGGILVNCYDDMDGAYSLQFLDGIEKDETKFLQYLRNLKASQSWQSLAPQAKQAVDGWIARLSDLQIDAVKNEKGF